MPSIDWDCSCGSGMKSYDHREHRYERIDTRTFTETGTLEETRVTDRPHSCASSCVCSCTYDDLHYTERCVNRYEREVEVRTYRCSECGHESEDYSHGGPTLVDEGCWN